MSFIAHLLPLLLLVFVPSTVAGDDHLSPSLDYNPVVSNQESGALPSLVEDLDEPDEDVVPSDGSAPHEVFWTVVEESTPQQIAESWGLRVSQLLKLNPELPRDGKVAAGTQLLVYRYDPEHPTRSIERPDNGRMWNGVPLPDGPNWLSKSHRFQWGSEVTVAGLLEIFAAYGEAYPDGQPIRVGDLSRRKGGEIARRHESHRSGRDVDLSYFTLGEFDPVDEPPITPENLDLEKTWFLIDTLLKSGKVQVIFVDKSLQVALNDYVKPLYTKDELAMLFEYPARVHSHRAVIQHWRNHADHLHVRFICEPGNWRCRGHGEWGE